VISLRSLCSMSQVDHFWRPPVSVCLTLVSSLQGEKIPGETLTICHRTRSTRGPWLPSRSCDFPFLNFHWSKPPQSITGRYDTSDGCHWMMLRSPEETWHHPSIWLFYCPWNVLRFTETCTSPSRLDCDRRCALQSLAQIWSIHGWCGVPRRKAAWSSCRIPDEGPPPCSLL